jgi:protein O-GlcNAc transferase
MLGRFLLDLACRLHRQERRASPSPASTGAGIKASRDCPAATPQHGPPEQELAHCLDALRAKPADYALHVNCSNVLKRVGAVAQARSALERATRLEPHRYEAWYNLGVLLFENWWLDESVEAFDGALAALHGHADPEPLRALVLSRALALQRAGDWESAGRWLEEMAAAHPLLASDCLRVALLGTVVSPEAGPDESLAAHRRWARTHADPRLPAGKEYANAPFAERPLRIGYVSGDLCSHAVSLFFEPVLIHHDRTAYEVICYDNSQRSDATSERLRRYPALWRNLMDLGDDACRERIERDGIDILVDLSGHTARNRLDVFALRPAPLQITWLGYRTSTGMAALDYRLTDAFVDPPGRSDRWYSERLLRLPDSQWCFGPDETAPDPGPLPMSARGHVTFGSFNQFDKLNEGAIETWAGILHRLPGSRLLMAGVPLGRRRQAFLAHWHKHGIAAERLDLFGYVSRPQYQALHREVDVALDAFPCNGGTTTCESLWMGVPVISLAGSWGVARAGVSLLNAAGLPDWVADDPASYIELAVERAGDRDSLALLRGGLRGRLPDTPLMHGARFTRGLEAALRGAWRDWCETRLRR